MALIRQSSIADTKAASSKSDKPSYSVEGQLALRFNQAKEASETAEAKLKEARAKLLDAGIKHIYQHNIDRPTAAVKTVELVDATGSSATITTQNRYSAANAEAAEQLFESLGKKYSEKIDINDFVQEAVVASFDSSIFNTGDNGEFNAAVYDAYAKAISETTAALVKKGLLKSNTESPLKTTKKVLPLEKFDESRWVLFPSVEDQRAILGVLPNTITLKAGDSVEPKTPVVEVIEAPKAIKKLRSSKAE